MFLASEFKKCNRKEPDLDKCTTEAARLGVKLISKAYPEIHLPSWNPLEVDELRIDAGSKGVVNVDQNFKKCKLFGFTNAVPHLVRYVFVFRLIFLCFYLFF